MLKGVKNFIDNINNENKILTNKNFDLENKIINLENNNKNLKNKNLILTNANIHLEKNNISLKNENITFNNTISNNIKIINHLKNKLKNILVLCKDN